MCDISDVVALLAQMSAAAAYPNGTAAPSAINAEVQVAGGWPIAAELDAFIARGAAMVTVFPQAGQSAAVYQVIDDTPYVVQPPVHGVIASVSGTSVTLTGAPGVGEFATLIVNSSHTYSSDGKFLFTILRALVAAAQAQFPDVTLDGTTITFPTKVRILECRIGAPATMGRVTHRQRALVTVTIWAATPSARDTLAAAVDVALKAVNRLIMPDGTQAVLAASHTFQRDERQAASIYRRDLVVSVEYATIEQYQAVEITSVSATLDSGPSIYGHVADDVIVTG